MAVKGTIQVIKSVACGHDCKYCGWRIHVTACDENEQPEHCNISSASPSYDRESAQKEAEIMAKRLGIDVTGQGE
jgi:biotin synthase-like enzyme